MVADSVDIMALTQYRTAQHFHLNSFFLSTTPTSREASLLRNICWNGNSFRREHPPHRHIYPSLSHSLPFPLLFSLHSLHLSLPLSPSLSLPLFNSPLLYSPSLLLCLSLPLPFISLSLPLPLPPSLSHIVGN